MPAQFDAVARVSVDLRGFREASQQVSRSGGDMEKTFARLHQSLTKVEAVEKSYAAERSRSLGLYNQMSSAAKAYTSAIQSLAKNSGQSARGTKLMAKAFEELRSALSSVTGLSAKEEARLARTLGLYERAANALRTYAQAQQAMLGVGQNMQREQTRAAEAARRLALEEQKVALARQQASNVAKGLSTTQRAAVNTAQQMGSAYTSAARGMSNFNESALAARADLTELSTLFQNVIRWATAFSRATVGAAISHEAAFAQVVRVTGATGSELDELTRGFQRLASQLPVSFEEFARIGQLAAQTGVANDALLSFSSTVAKFAVTTGIGTEQITLLFGRIQQMQDIPISQMENFASTILALGTASASTEDEILKVEESIATVTNLFKLSHQATAGLASSFATLRVRPELARGALTRVFNDLAKAIQGGGQKLQVLARLMDMTDDSVKKLYESDPDQFFLRFVKGLSGVKGQANGLQGALRALGVNAVRDIDTFSRLGNNFELLSSQMSLANTEWQSSGTLERQSQTILDTTRQKLDNLKDAFGTFLANIGQGVAAGLGTAAQHLTVFVEAMNDAPGAIKAFGTVAVTLSGVVAALAAFRVATVAAQRTSLALSSAVQGFRGGFAAIRNVVNGVSGALIGYSGASSSAARSTQANVVALQRQAQAANAARAASSGASGAGGASVAAQAAAQQRLAAAMAASTAARLRLNEAMALGTAEQARSAAIANASAASAVAQARAASVLAGTQKGMSASAAAANAALGSQAFSSRAAASAYQGLAARQREAAATASRFNSSLSLSSAAAANTATAVRNAGVSMTGLANVQRVYGAALVGAHRAEGDFVRNANLATTAVTTQNAALTLGTRVAQAFGIAGRFVMANWAPLLVLGLALTPMIMAWSSAQSKATDNAKEWAKQAREAAGGTAELQQAIEKDTKAFRDHGDAVKTYTVKSGELTGAARQTYEQTKKTAESLQGQVKATYGSAEAMAKVAKGQGNAAAAARSLKKDLDSANESLRNQGKAGTVAFGSEAVRKTQEAMRHALDTSKVTSSDAELKRFQKTGIDLGKTFALLGQKGKGPVAALESLKPALAAANEELRKLKEEQKKADTRFALTRGDFSVVARNKAAENKKAVDAQVKAAQRTYDAVKAQMNVISENETAFNKLARAQKILSGSARDAAKGMDTMGAAAEEDLAALQEFDETVKQISGTLQGVGGPASAWANAMEMASASNSKMSKSQVETAVTTRQLLDAMRQGAEAQLNYTKNLVEVISKVPQDLAIYLSKLGPEGAQQVALLNKMTESELNEYVKLWNQTGPDATDSLSYRLTEAIPTLAQKGGAVGKAVADSITAKMKTGDISGAMADLQKSVELLDLLKANPKVNLDTAPAKLSMDQLIAWVKVRAFELDVKGKANLDDSSYKLKVQELLASIVGEKGAKKFDIDGLAKLNDSDFKLKLQGILGQLLDGKANKKFDIDGLAKLSNEEFLKKLGDIIGRIQGLKQNGQLNITSVAKLDTGEFNRKLGGLVQAAYSTGSQIQSALSRTATVNVVYRNANNPPPRAISAATGGWIHGPGTSTSDSIPANLSNNEFVVRAKQAKKHASLLEAINAGRPLPKAVAASIPRVASSRRVALDRFDRSPRRLVGAMGRDTLKRVEGRPEVRTGPVINVNNTYPRAEPTSTTINRSLAYAAALNGTI
ncbi:phage tail tape measure protein [Streptomyces sp. NPDC000927]|uniref:phage tail tape measure protein n=1 Tax=Streptomyces sp. NPDC000927 TaxID=3154371 RepID=UPI00331898E6